MTAEPTSYWDYIRVEELLGLQRGLAESHEDLQNEEVLFITVHQVYELWFQVILRDLKSARDLFTARRVAEQELSGVVERLRRIATILRVAVDHFAVVETLGTRAYLAFRDKLMPASGFQSAQLRQIEILFGLDDDERIPLGPPGSHLAALRDYDGSPSSALKRVEATMADTPTRKAALEDWLARTPIDAERNADGTVHSDPDGFVERYLEAHAAVVGKSRARAQTVAEAAGRDVAEEQARLATVYERERSSVEAFLRDRKSVVWGKRGGKGGGAIIEKKEEGGGADGPGPAAAPASSTSTRRRWSTGSSATSGRSGRSCCPPTRRRGCGIRASTASRQRSPTPSEGIRRRLAPIAILWASPLDLYNPALAFADSHAL